MGRKSCVSTFVALCAFAVCVVIQAFGASASAPAVSSGPSPANDTTARQPILVELFTSEGCSSCPPADQLLEKFDKQPLPGADLIVLSEHVDYWNHEGWTDPYSSAAYSQRQSLYGDRFHLKSVYTPQMVVDGDIQFVGDSDGDARDAFAKSETQPKVDVRLSNVEIKDGKLHAHVQSDSLPANLRKADVLFVIALDHAESQVARGENAGRRLTHVAVARSWNSLGTASPSHPFDKDVAFSLGHDLSGNLRVVVFLQEAGQGRILGATQVSVPR